MTQYTDELSKLLLEELEGEEEEVAIATVANTFLTDLSQKYPNVSSRKNPLADLRRAVQEKYPTTEKQIAPWQYPTTTGKRQTDSQGNPIPNPERWQHFALKYLTLAPQEWEQLRTKEANTEPAAAIVEDIKQPEQTQPTAKQPKAKKATKRQKLPVRGKQNQKVKPKPPAKDLLTQLPLDDESLNIVREAICTSNLSPVDFIAQAVLAQAKIQVGRAKKYSQDLTTTSTEELLSPKFKTHPKRTEELTRRAVQAICLYNDQATEPEQRWYIGMLAIQCLIGGSQASVRSAMKSIEGAITDHNNKYNLGHNQNRKSYTIADVIDLAKLVPDGLS